MKYGYFITGTDTDVGKTLAAAALLTRAGERGFTTAAWKPVAAGACQTPDGLRNDDALTLIEACTEPLAYPQVNPRCFSPPIAPHIAAREAGVAIDVATLMREFPWTGNARADLLLVEGAGGWRVPLNDRETTTEARCARCCSPTSPRAATC